MKNLIPLLLSIVLFTFTVKAQSDQAAKDQKSNGWEIAADINLANSQSVHSDNWESSESGTFAWTSSLNASAEKQLSKLTNIRNTLKLEFGQLQTKENIDQNWSDPQKSADNIDFESLFRITYGGIFDPYLNGRLQSFFTDERVDPTEYFNPILLTESAGISRTLVKKEKRELITRTGLATRQRFDKVYSIDPVTGDPISKTISDAGIEWVTNARTPLFGDRISMTSRFSVFQAFYNSNTKDLEGLPEENYWKSTDFEIESIFNANITKFIIVNMNLRWLYDREIDAAGRFKEGFSLGLTYILI